MEKILKILHKKLDKKDKNIEMKKRNKEMESLFSFDHISYVNKHEFDYYKNEIIYYGILNKQTIEKAYKKAKIDMEDYYDALNYEQKKKLMDYEIKNCLKDLKSFKYDDQNIYIPFFEKKLNFIYENEMTLFDLKKYADIMLYYDSIMKKDLYTYSVYDSPFSSLQFIYEDKERCALYCEKRGRLYFLCNNEYQEFISLPLLEKDKMAKVAFDYFENNVNALIEDLYNFNCIDDKLNKKLNKSRK